MSEEKDNNEVIPKLTDKQKRFCEEYVVDLNATQAAIRSGYSPKTSRSVGSENLTKPDVRKYISILLQKKAMHGDEAVKLIGDIARSSLNDYFVIRQIEYTPKVKKSLQVIIDELQAEMDFEWEYGLLAEFNDKEQEAHDKRQKERQRRLLRYKLELKHNPNASRIVDGQTVLTEEAVLDLVKLVKDKEAGKIKSISYGPAGPKVEMYAADAALRDVAKMTGKLTEKVDLSTKGEKLPAAAAPIVFIPADKLTPEQIEQYLKNAAGPSNESLS